MAAKRPLEAADLDRLSKLCGLFSSDFEGERANAAGLADRFLRDRGWRWPDVIHAPALAPPASKPKPAPDDWPDALRDWPENWRIAIDLCQRAAACLPPKDVAFLASISGYQHQPSAAQIAWLRNVIDRARAGRRP
jgi:hypothetical protein